MRTAKDTTRIRTLLLRWYRRYQRPFPWRVADPDPYVVLVSETMLQQTQAQRVAELLPPFLERYPNVQALAQASNADVIRSWKGLGYNNRAIRLRDAARLIVQDHQGRVPAEEDQLISLPGIGPYAAASVTTFAFNTRTVVLDVNVRRVYSRLHSGQPLTTSILDDETLRAFAEAVIPRRAASEWHHAVMDLGATICMARKAHCGECPLQKVCPSAGMIQSATKPRSRKSELMFRGQPRRIWRGRIVEALRQHPNGRASAVVLKEVFSSLAAEDRAFVDDLIARLISDGLVERVGRRLVLAQ